MAGESPLSASTDFPSDEPETSQASKRMRPQIGVHGSTDDQKAEWAACALDVNALFPPFEC